MTPKPLTIDQTPLYLVMSWYGEALGYEGYSHPTTTFKEIVSNIVNGQEARAIQVFELFEGRCNDISQKVADHIWTNVQVLDISKSAETFLGLYGYDLIAEQQRAA